MIFKRVSTARLYLSVRVCVRAWFVFSSLASTALLDCNRLADENTPLFRRAKSAATSCVCVRAFFRFWCVCYGVCGMFFVCDKLFSRFCCFCTRCAWCSFYVCGGDPVVAYTDFHFCCRRLQFLVWDSPAVLHRVGV